MSGFSPEWLSLREPADHRARNASLLEAACAPLRLRQSVSIVDLGCGTGSNLRGMAASLPERQNWTLVDYDPDLLEAARTRLTTWADAVQPKADGSLHLSKYDRNIEVSFKTLDLMSDLPSAFEGSPDLVTSAAFFDLASAGWIERFAAELASHRLPLYTILTYTGAETWRPAHHHDSDILSAFLHHQITDKGFGAAAGPNATSILAGSLRAHGYRVETAPSPWELDKADKSLMQSLARGIAGAVRETGQMDDAALQDWLSAREDAASCTIGHFDLLASAPR